MRDRVDTSEEEVAGLRSALQEREGRLISTEVSPRRVLSFFFPSSNERKLTLFLVFLSPRNPNVLFDPTSGKQSKPSNPSKPNFIDNTPLEPQLETLLRAFPPPILPQHPRGLSAASFLSSSNTSRTDTLPLPTPAPDLPPPSSTISNSRSSPLQLPASDPLSLSNTRQATSPRLRGTLRPESGLPCMHRSLSTPTHTRRRRSREDLVRLQSCELER